MPLLCCRINGETAAPSPVLSLESMFPGEVTCARALVGDMLSVAMVLRTASSTSGGVTADRSLDSKLLVRNGRVVLDANDTGCGNGTSLIASCTHRLRRRTCTLLRSICRLA